MDKKDLYKMRAEEFAKSFESLRSVEWRVTFQLYTGYTLLGVAYFHLLSAQQIQNKQLISVMVIVVTLLLWAPTFYLSFRIQERQRFARAVQNKYLGKLHDTIKVKRLEEDKCELDVPMPIHQGWYAFLVQRILSIVFAVGLILFVVFTTWLG